MMMFGKTNDPSIKLSGRAQSLVEFALILPILLLLIMGTFDLGRLFYIKITLVSAAREGAYYLSYHTDDPANCVGGVCYQGTRQAISVEANNMGVQVVPANVTIGGTVSSGNTITVTVSQTVNLFIFNFIRGPVTVSSSVRMVVQ
jgi:Flp pilus assembly protein TadG